jgi:DNA topoisomerase-3
MPASQRTVKKEGFNSGRSFYACSKAQSDASRCDFFQWADEAGAGPSRAQTSTVSHFLIYFSLAVFTYLIDVAL